MRKRLLQAVALLALSSCVIGGGPGGAWRPDGEIQIHIVNNNFADATIWLVVGGSPRDRLGRVTGKSDETFVVPWDSTEPLRLELDMLAGPRCRTRQMIVEPGDVVQLEIEPTFSQTAWCERR